MKKIGLLLGAFILATFLGAITAFACSGTISVYGTLGNNGFDAVVSCQLTGEDASWCYYDCTCTGRNATETRCDQLYARAGLVDV
jgi:hypothetical protein